MHQITKEYFLTLLAFLILPGGTIFSLIFFKPIGAPWQSVNGVMAFLGMLLAIIIYLVLLSKRGKSIDNRIRINFH